jgi:Flp pilus assembly protein CpaB
MRLPKLALAMIVFGALLAFAAWALGVAAVDKKAGDVRRGWTLRPVVVAREDLEAGMTLGDAQLELGSVPDQLISASHFTDKSALLGKRLSIALAKGTPIPTGAVIDIGGCP